VDIIDDEGRLFGAVNVIDALVVLLVLAVTVAGVALVFGQSDEPAPEPETDTVYATLDLGTQSSTIATAINEGDSYEVTGSNSLTISDLYVTPSGDGRPRVLARVALTGQISDQYEGISYDGAPPRLGRSLEIAPGEYRVDGRIRAVGDTETISQDSATVVVSDRLSRSAAQAIAIGDEIRVAGRTTGTIEDLAVYATDDPNAHQVYAQVAVSATQRQNELRFGGSVLTNGASITLPGDEYTLSGTVERVGGGLNRATENVLITNVIDATDAQRIATGDISSVAGHQTAAVERVTVYDTNNPDRKRVFMGLSMTTVQHTDRPQFGEMTVQRGNNVTVQTDAYRLVGKIQRTGALEQRGRITTRTMTFRLEEIREELASSIQPGLTERSGEDTIVQVTNVNRRPSTILIRGDDGSLGVFDHPTNRDVTITARVQVRQTTDGVRLKGHPVRQGEQVTIDLGVTTIRPTVTGIQ